MTDYCAECRPRAATPTLGTTPRRTSGISAALEEVALAIYGLFVVGLSVMSAFGSKTDIWPKKPLLTFSHMSGARSGRPEISAHRGARRPTAAPRHHWWCANHHLAPSSAVETIKTPIAT